jgi:hypothetical protein
MGKAGQAVRSTGLINLTIQTRIAYGHFTREISPRPTYPTNTNFSLYPTNLVGEMPVRNPSLGMVWKAA